MKLKRGEIVEVTWDDAAGDSGWETGDPPWPEMRCKTVGYFLKQNNRAVMICDSLFKDWRKKDGTVGGVVTIPRGMVVKIVRLRRARS